MIAFSRFVKLAGGLLAAAALQGCADGKVVNPLLLIDEPFVSPSERAAQMAIRQPALADAPIRPARNAGDRAPPVPVVVARLGDVPPAVQAEPAPAAGELAESAAPPATRSLAAPSTGSTADPVAGPPDAIIAAVPEERADAPDRASAALAGTPATDSAPPADGDFAAAFDGLDALPETATQASSFTEVELAPNAPPLSPPASAQAIATDLSDPVAQPATIAQSAPLAVEEPPAAVANTALEREAAALGLSVVGGMPAPGAANALRDRAGGSADYAEFFAFALNRLEGSPQAGGRQSLLLADPLSLAPNLLDCGNAPPAVLVDLDPGAGLLPLVGDNRAQPALASYLGQLRDKGVTIYWISGHGPEAAGRIRGILGQSGLDPAGIDPLIVTRFAGESKQRRRIALGETNCLLAILGDRRADFDDLYDFLVDPSLAAPLEELVGNGWFLAPPPID